MLKNTSSIMIMILLLSLAGQLAGQEYRLQVIAADSITDRQIQRLRYNESPSGKQTAQRELRKILDYFYNRGYITASFDSIHEDSVQMKAYLHTGNEYTMTMIRKGNVPGQIINQIRFKERVYSNRPLRIREIQRLMEKIIRWCENHGYPFAMVKLDSILFDQQYGVGASLNLNLHQKVMVDTIIVKGNSKIHRKFLRNYFNIKQGDLYNEMRFRRVGEKLEDLPFVSVIRPHEVVFTDDRAKLILYLDKRRASQFDGILGIAPNDDADGKLLLTGDIKLKLVSAFNRGELIDLNWRKLEAQSQDLRFNFNFPFIFNTPFGFDYRLQLYKKDTSYLTLVNNLGIQVLFNGYNNVKAFFESQVSSLLSTAGLEYATALPEYADVTTNMYGLGLDYTRVDYRYNPRRGYLFGVDGAIGSKTIKRNSNVNQALYDSIPLSSTLYRIQCVVQGYMPLFRNTALMLGNRSAYLENKNLFDNELFRIGGLKTLRGFDEESITASAYTIFTLEFRYLFDRNSFFQVFFDGAYYERDANSGYFSDTPYGIGAGISFETRAGIFTLSYALGSRDGQPLQFKSAKVHFGLTARF